MKTPGEWERELAFQEGDALDGTASVLRVIARIQREALEAAADECARKAIEWQRKYRREGRDMYVGGMSDGADELECVLRGKADALRPLRHASHPSQREPSHD